MVSIVYESLLREEGPACPWKSETNEFTVAPGSVYEYELYALPTELGLFKDRMIVMVDDNSEPYIYKIQCEGFSPEISVSPTEIDFGNLLLNQSLTRQIKIENPSKIPVKVSLIPNETEQTQFTLSATEFIINQFDEY